MFSYDIRAVGTKTKFKIGAVLSESALAAVFFLGIGTGHAAVGGPLCNVPADYPTIQAAVNDPGCTTVKVAAGTYHENVTITRSVTIKGAKAGVNVNSRTASGPAESTVDGTGTDTPDFTISSPNVTIDGFSVTNVNQGTAIDVKTAGNNAVIENNIVDKIGSLTYPANATGIYLDLGPDNVSVSGNKITHVSSIPTAQAVLVGDSTSTDPSLNARFTGNTIGDVISTNKGAYGIQVNSGAKNNAFATVKILNNTIRGLNGGGWAHGIGLEGKTPNAVVRGNTFSNLVDANCANASQTLSCSTGFNDVDAVVFQDNIYFFTADVSHNNLAVGSGNYGIAVDPALVSALPSLNVDGQCNYWGASNGPSSVGSGSGSHVSTGVDYSPWLHNSNLNSHCGDNHDNDNHGNDGVQHDELGPQ